MDNNKTMSSVDIYFAATELRQDSGTLSGRVTSQAKTAENDYRKMVERQSQLQCT